jgi:hypothetical protein
VTRTVHHHGQEEEEDPLGKGVHSAYEDSMVNAHRKEILDGLEDTPEAKPNESIQSGFEAAKATIEMMRSVFERLPPRKIVQFYVASDAKPKQLAEDMWDEFGKQTIECMQDGVHLLAVLWQSAWVLGKRDQTISASALKALSPDKAMEIYQDEDFVPSVSIDKIGAILRQPV